MEEEEAAAVERGGRAPSVAQPVGQVAGQMQHPDNCQQIEHPSRELITFGKSGDVENYQKVAEQQRQIALRFNPLAAPAVQPFARRLQRFDNRRPQDIIPRQHNQRPDSVNQNPLEQCWNRFTSYLREKSNANSLPKH